MKRFHVHVSVGDLNESVRFYSTLFGAEPTVLKSDYAKWMLEDPRVNFAISQRSVVKGIEHVGIQVENRSELAEVYSRLQRAERPVLEEGATTCCYAQSEKSWTADPQGIQWETFLTTGESTVYGHDREPVESSETARVSAGGAGANPATPQPSSCCAPSCCAPRAA